MASFNIIRIDETSSTNDEAKKIALKEAEEGTVVVAKRQTSGKGRLGRKWDSNDEDSIYMSVILKPNAEAKNISKLTLIIGLCVRRAIIEILEDESIEVALKWPNDVYVNKKKVCGILCELTTLGNAVNFIIAGIGVNVNNEKFDEWISNKATSLFLESGKKFSKDKLIHTILNNLNYYYTEFQKDFSLSKFLNEYVSVCMNIGNTYIEDGTSGTSGTSGKETGVVVSISEDGELIYE